MSSSVLDILVGRTVTAVWVRDEQLHVSTDLGEFVFGAEGDCCAHAYWDQVESPELQRDALVTAVDQGAWSGEDDGDYYVVESCFPAITTTQGVITATLRVSHNGYYGGRPTLVSKPEGC